MCVYIVFNILLNIIKIKNKQNKIPQTKSKLTKMAVNRKLNCRAQSGFTRESPVLASRPRDIKR